MPEDDLTKEPESMRPANAAPEVIAVDPHADEICCDGGGGPLGHPKVWYTFDGQDPWSVVIATVFS